MKNERNFLKTSKEFALNSNQESFVSQNYKTFLNHHYKKTNRNHNDKDLLFKDIIFLWQKANKINHKSSTEIKYDYLIKKHILPSLGELKPKEINSILVNDFMNKKLEKKGEFQKSLSPSYVRSMMLIITSALDFANSEKLCEPVVVKIHKPSIPKKELKILSLSDQIRYEKYLFDNLNNLNLGILITLNTGLRIGEVCALKWNDIDFERNVILVRSTVTRIMSSEVNNKPATALTIDTPKTATSAREIPIPSKLLNAIKNCKKVSISEFVISSSTNFLSPRTYEYQFKKTLKECEIEPINYHALRHTFATRCVEVGMDVKTLSEILGHSSVNITLNTYVHSSLELKRTQIEKLNYLGK